MGNVNCEQQTSLPTG